MNNKMLQMIIPAYGNGKKLTMFIELIKKFIKKNIGLQKQGKPRWDINKTICGILYYLKSGCQWRLLPSIFGKWRTIYGWYRSFNKLETFKRLWQEIVKYAGSKEILKVNDILGDGSLILTTSNIEIKAKNPRIKNKNCINRLILTDKNGLPISLLLAKGTAHDTNYLIPLIDQIKELIQLPENFTVHADKGFDSISNRWGISLRSGTSVIPVRDIGFDTEYPKCKDKKRPIVEHALAWINAFKALKVIATKLISNLYENTYFVFATIISRVLKIKDIKTLIRYV
jgi:transposase